jgi:hypothetical protein
MNVLFLDDDARRIESFRRRVPRAVTVETAEECIARLEDGARDPARPAWDLVFLDHDLGGEFFVESERPDTGMEVVRWVLVHRPRVGKFVVHTHNLPAGDEMERLLVEAGYDAIRIPFGWFDPAEFLGTPPEGGESDGGTKADRADS